MKYYLKHFVKKNFFLISIKTTTDYFADGCFTTLIYSGMNCGFTSNPTNIIEINYDSIDTKMIGSRCFKSSLSPKYVSTNPNGSSHCYIA